MASTGINIGTLIGVYVGGTKVTHATSCTLNFSADMIDISTKDSADDQDLKPGRKTGRTIAVEALFAENATYGFDDLFDAYEAGTALTILWSSAVSGDVTYSSSAYVSSLSANAADQEAESYSATFSLTGATTKGTVS
jgi:hypothetical protein